MNSRTTTVAILLTLGMGIGIAASFAVSTMFQSNRVISPPDETLESQNTQNGNLNKDRALFGHPSRSQSAIPHNITDVTVSNSSYQQRVEISSWILALDEKRLVDLLEQSSQPNWDVSPRVRKDFQAILLSKLTSFNPTRALDFALARVDPARSVFVQTVFFEWAIADLDSAIEHAKDVVAQELRTFALQGILLAQDSLTLTEHKAIAKELGDESFATTYHLRKFLYGSMKNPKEAWYQVIALTEPNHEHYQILTQIAATWIQASGIDVLDEIISSVSDDDMRAAVSLEILGEVARSMPDQAFAFALNLESDYREFVASRVVETWAEQDPHSALKAAQVVPPSQFLNDLQFSAVSQWVQSNPRDVLGRLAELPVSTRESAVTEAIYLIAQDAPTEAASLVAVLDKEFQWNARDILLESWLSQDFEAAIDWVENSKSIESADRPYLLQDLAAKVVWIDLERAFQIARQVSLLTESTIGSEAMIIGRIAQSDVSLALELLPQVRAGDTKTQSYVTVASKLIEQGNTPAALGLGSQLPKSDQNEFFVNLAQNWAYRDATGLLAKMESFPTREIRSKIAVSLHRINSNSKSFTDSQLAQLESYLSTEDKASLENSP